MLDSLANEVALEGTMAPRVGPVNQDPGGVKV
jgi:hypothetical protein